MAKRGLVLLIVVFVFICIMGNDLISAVNSTIVTSPFYYSFNTNGTLYESGTMQESSSPYWWLNSGAKLIILGGVGKTVQGSLLTNEKWRLIYLASNPIDTDKGYHPQNIFRLITRSKWKNFNESTYFKIKKDQLSFSPNRDVSNGLLLISRYQDDNNLYYSGIRVDGNAIIKKKFNGQYTTLASKKIFSGTYSKQSNPNLLPKDTWIGLKSKINTTNGKTKIQLFMDENKTGNWTLILEATDTKSQIITEGYGGIRTDFMDVEFDDFRIVNN